jgi:hypothetical protein
MRALISRNVKNCSTIDAAQHPEDWRIRFDSSWKSHNQPHMIVPSGPEYPKDFRKYIKAKRPNVFVWTLCHWRPPSHLRALWIPDGPLSYVGLLNVCARTS